MAGASWQLSTLPAVPEYWRCTPTEVVPFLRNPVSSTTSTPARVAQVLDHIAAQVVADQVRVPPGGGQQPLHPVRGALPGMLGQLSAILAAHVAQQPRQIRQHAPARLDAGEPTADPGVQRLQPGRPRLYFLNLCCRPIGVRHGPSPS
jgi:hypothetical protein